MVILFVIFALCVWWMARNGFLSALEKSINDHSDKKGE